MHFISHNLTSNTHIDEDSLLLLVGAGTATVPTMKPKIPLEIADSKDDSDSDDNSNTSSTKTSKSSKYFAAPPSTLSASVKAQR